MQTGALTGYIDVAQLVLYAFWIFFVGLIIYLRREDKREGYPLESDRTDRSGGRIKVQGFPAMPSPKEFKLAHGGVAYAPDTGKDLREVHARPVAPWPGAPLHPTGDPMQDGVGPASYVKRSASPDLTLEGLPKIVPLRVAADYSIATGDPDVRGFTVYGGDRVAAGVVADIWVDRSEAIIRFLEVEVSSNGRRVLVPMPLAKVEGTRGRVTVNSVFAAHFATAPQLADSQSISMSEEDRVSAYFASGNLYAEPARLGPWL
jgi:photosynthetic reaction center H subunit